MRILLDTHVWLWMAAAPERMSASARGRSAYRANELYLSAASAWEIAIRDRIGRLPLPEPPERFVPLRLLRDGVLPLAVEHPHALRVAGLPDHHRDPFDRLLIAQALCENLVLYTADEKPLRYPAPCELVG